jgi:hypothetical protein
MFDVDKLTRHKRQRSTKPLHTKNAKSDIKTELKIKKIMSLRHTSANNVNIVNLDIFLGIC